MTQRKYSKMNEWYPPGLQISLHIRSPGLQDYSEVWNLKFSQFRGGNILKLSDLDSLTIFIFWGGILKLSDSDSLIIFIGGYSETPGFGLSDNFHLGGYSETLRFGLSDNFHFGGVFWNSQIWTLWQFLFWGEGEGEGRGYSTDSLSHVETNKSRY